MGEKGPMIAKFPGRNAVFAVEGGHQGSCAEVCAAQYIHKKKWRKGLSDGPLPPCRPFPPPQVLEGRKIYLHNFKYYCLRHKFQNCVLIKMHRMDSC